MPTLETPSQVTSPTQPDCDTSCVSGDAARVVEGHLIPQKGVPTIRTSDMGTYNSVPETSMDEANITLSRAGEDLCPNINISHRNESQKVKARRKERNDARNNPVESEVTGQEACPRGNGDPACRVVSKLNELEKNMCQQETYFNLSKDRVVKPKESLVPSYSFKFGSGSFEDTQKDEINSEDSCDSFSSMTTTIVFQNKCQKDKDVRKDDNSKSEQKNVENSSILIYNKPTGSISNNFRQCPADVSLEVENRNWKEKNIDAKYISKKTMSKETLQPHSQNHKSCVGASNKADLETSETNFEITIEEVRSSNVTVDRVSNSYTQNHDDVLLEVEKRNWKENNIVFKHISKNTMNEETSQSHCLNHKSPEGASNEVDLETAESDIEVTIEEVSREKNTIIFDTQTNMEHGSAGIDSAVTGDFCNVSNDEFVYDQEQQIESEVKENKAFFKKKDQLTKENDTVLKSAENCSSVSQKNKERCEIEELLKIDSNTCDKDHIEIEPVSELSSQDETLKTSDGDCGVNSVTKCEDNSNREAFTKLPIQIEVNQELSTNSTESPTKEHNASVSSENSPVKQSPIFQRGSFPRIVIRDCGMRTINRLRKQLLQEREKREKREQERKVKKLDNKQNLTRRQGIKNRKVAKKLSTLEYDSSKICGSRDDIKLKCAKVCLMKMNERMLSKYNVHLLSSHSHASVCSKLNGDELSVSAKRNNLTPEITSHVEPAELIPDDREQIENNRFSPGMQDAEKFKKGNNYACSSDDTSGSGPCTVKIISNSRSNSKISHLENIANNFTENDNNVKCVEIKGRSKRRASPQLHTTTKKQRQSEMKVARVHILKIDNSVLSKYGYDSQSLEINKVALDPSPSFAHLSSVCFPIHEDNSQKSVESNKLNNQILLNQSTCAINDSYPVTMEDSVHLVTKMSNDKEEINVNPKNTNSKTSKNVGLEAVRLILNDEDVPLSNCSLLKNTSPNRTEKSMGKTKCPLKKNNLNIKSPKVMGRNLEGVNRSSCIVPKKSSNVFSAKTTPKTNNTFKNVPPDRRMPQVIVRKIEDSSFSNHVLLKRSMSTTKPKSKIKSSIRGESSLKTAKVLRKNFNQSPLASQVLSKNLLMRTHSNDRVSKNNLNIRSSESLQVKTLPNKRIICQSKHCDDFQNQNETKTNRANSSKNDVVQDHPKENVCVNSNQKHLRVCLYKLENMIPPKL